MKQPKGFEDGTGRVCLLKRSLYGLKQAGHYWNQKFNSKMIKLGYTRLKSDYCAYIRRKESQFSIILVWVDDLILISNSKDEGEIAENELKGEFNLKIIGEPSLLLGIQVKRDRKQKTISLSQSNYIRTILKRAGMENANPVTTPMDPNVALIPLDEKDDECEPDNRASSLFATEIGSLIYLAICTRPDISYAVQTLAQFTKRPSATHWTALKRIYRYLLGTLEFKLVYGGPEQNWEQFFFAYGDADWGSNSHRKSISGYVIMLAGGAIAWSSKKQTTTALSTAEAEYVALAHTFKQVLWLRSLFQELELSLPPKLEVYSDNQAAIAISRNPEHHARTKHIDIAYHFLRDYVEDGDLEVIYVPTKDNLADLFTKALARPQHQKLTYNIGVMPEQGGVLE
jgi:hypothetical protein